MLEKEVQTCYLDNNHIPHLGEIIVTSGGLLRELILTSFSHFPRRISTMATEVMVSQFRITPFQGKKHHAPRMFRGKEFPLDLDFLKIRSIVKPDLAPVYRNWKEQFHQFMKQTERSGHHHHTGPHRHKGRHHAATTLHQQEHIA
jgi:poly(A) polymerase